MVDLPASFGPRMTVSPGGELDVERAVATEIPAVEPADPHSDTSWPASSSRPRRSASRCSAASTADPAASSSAMRVSRSRMNAPAIVSDDGSGPSVRAGTEPSRTRTFRNAGASGDLDLVDVEVEVVAADAHETDVEDEVRVRARHEALDEGRLAGHRRGIQLEAVEAGPADLAFLDADGPSARPLVERDQEDLAGSILVERDRLGGAGVGVGDRSGLAELGRVPVAEGEIVETRRGDLLGRDDDLVGVGLAGDRERAVDHADVPGGGRFGRHGRGDLPERAVRGALGAEHLAVDHRVDGRQVDGRVVGVEDGDHALVGVRAGHRRQVVGPVDRRPVVAVVRARDDDAPDPGVGEPLQLGRDALDRPARLDVRVEQVAGDEEEVDLLRDGEVDGSLEGRELAFALSGRLLTEIVVSRTQVDVSGMDDPEHRDVGLPPRGWFAGLIEESAMRSRERTAGGGPRYLCERGAPMTPRSPTPLSTVIVTGRASRSPSGNRPGWAPARTIRARMARRRPLFATRCILPGTGDLWRGWVPLVSAIIRATLAASSVVPTRRAPHTYAPPEDDSRDL